MKVLRAWLLLIPVFSVYGCASESLKEVTYEGLYARECLQKSGTMNCNPDKPSYQDYKRERDEYLEK